MDHIFWVLGRPLAAVSDIIPNPSKGPAQERSGKIIQSKQHFPEEHFLFPATTPRCLRAARGGCSCCAFPLRASEHQCVEWEYKVPGSGHRAPARIPRNTGSPGRALGGSHTLQQARGKERSTGHVPAALFEVTTQSDPWKSWRASKLQPCCPARLHCAHPLLISTPIHQFFPCVQCPIPFSCPFCAGGSGDPAAKAGILALPVSVCGFNVDKLLCRKHPCGIHTGESVPPTQRLFGIEVWKRQEQAVIAFKIRAQSITLDFTRPASNKRAVIYELSVKEEHNCIKN